MLKRCITLAPFHIDSMGHFVYDLQHTENERRSFHSLHTHGVAKEISIYGEKGD